MYYFLRAEAYKSQPMFGRHGAHKHHDSMGEVNVDNNLYRLLLYMKIKNYYYL